MITRKKMPLAVGAVVSLLATAGLSGCSLGKPEVGPEELNRLKGLHDQFCPNDEHVNTFIGNDRSASESEVINDQLRIPAIRQEIELAVVCNGKVSVNDFAGSSGAIVQLYAGQIGTDNGTLNSRLRKVSDEVVSIMSEVASAQAKEAPLLSRKGTNIAAQYANAASFFTTVTGQDNFYRVVLLTDGAATSTEASTVKLPDTTTVVIAGVGKFDAKQPQPSEARIKAMKVALDQTCATTGASCVKAATNYEGPATN